MDTPVQGEFLTIPVLSTTIIRIDPKNEIFPYMASVRAVASAALLCMSFTLAQIAYAQDLANPDMVYAISRCNNQYMHEFSNMTYDRYHDLVSRCVNERLNQINQNNINNDKKNRDQIQQQKQATTDYQNCIRQDPAQSALCRQRLMSALKTIIPYH
jgi:hypothetical protein